LNLEIASGHLITKDYVNKEFVQKGLGIEDATDAEIEQIFMRPQVSVYYFANMISRRAQIGWSTHGHSAVDVNIYGTAGSDRIRGNNENTDVGKFLREYLNVDVDQITKELKQSLEFSIASEDGHDWTGRTPSEEDIRSALGRHEKLYGEAPFDGSF